MTCTNCTQGRVYDLACNDCRVRLVVSCRSRKAPGIARRQQDAMLNAIERNQGRAARQQTIDEIKGAQAA